MIVLIEKGLATLIQGPGRLDIENVYSSCIGTVRR
jgi:hypothetical protein